MSSRRTPRAVRRIKEMLSKAVAGTTLPSSALSSPTTAPSARAVAVGTGIGARYNILIKDAATLENVSGITAIVLDKTGTLTEGKPALTDVFVVGNMEQHNLLRLVASAERGSEHRSPRQLWPAPASAISR
jgi:hypothetical protein